MLVNLTPKPNYLTIRKQHIRKVNQHWSYNREWRWRFPARFDYIFKSTGITGVYDNNFDGDIINFWCKQFAYYSNKGHSNGYDQWSKNAWFFGVADNYQQIVDFYNRNEEGIFKGNHVISTFIVRKNPDEPYSGWRWHKWGPYIGTQDPCCEYLNDEPEIEQVVCFNIYKVR